MADWLFHPLFFNRRLLFYCHTFCMRCIKVSISALGQVLNIMPVLPVDVRGESAVISSLVTLFSSTSLSVTSAASPSASNPMSKIQSNIHKCISFTHRYTYRNVHYLLYSNKIFPTNTYPGPWVCLRYHWLLPDPSLLSLCALG